ncbi:MAG: ABC transporter permease, partial [Chloroflexi bacterium]|nr:ABC transporter permease [Chloroflexota bacterium]
MTILIIAQLTIQEAQRRRILWLSLLMALSFLAIFGVGLHYIMAELERISMAVTEMQVATGLLLSAGLYVVNFLIIIMAVLTSVTAVSGEID